MTALPDEQTGIKNWFNQTYQREGFGYLRPLVAYAIYAKLLALQPQYRLHREVLMETLWPDLAPESAANNLRVALHRARQRLEDMRKNVKK